MNGLVSVIIPVYNTSQYLEMCLNSVVNQTHQELQIILVDDGSTDCSPQMCDEWAAKDSRIEVIHKQNEGLGYTRNAGLAIARGEFVSFLDSDDTLDLNTIEECVKVLNQQEADACYYGRKTQHADGSVTLNHNYPEKLVYAKEEVKHEFAARYFGGLPNCNEQDYIQASVCCAMYRKSTIINNDILFRSERECMSEDTFFNLDVCKHAAKVIIILQDFYNYTYNAQSLTKKYNPSKFNQFKNYYELLVKYSLDYQNISDIKPRINYTFYVYLRHVIAYEVHACSLIGFGKVYSNIKKICLDPFVRENFKNFSMDMLDGKRKLFMKAIDNKQILFLIGYFLLLKRK